jgi:putative SbcD/Mre11-related phosphoesterase
MRGYRLDADIELLPGGAVVLRKTNAVVVADLHLGSEAALEHEGLSLPRVQARKIGAYLRSVVEAIGPDQLIIAGDLKHNFSRNLSQEWTEVSDFVNAISEIVDIVVVRGNHDNFLSTILGEMNIPLRSKYCMGGYTIVHGHAESSVEGPVIMGHIHPSIALRDDVGAGLKSPCFLHDESRGMLVLPALSIVSPGVDIVGTTCADSMSPLVAPSGLGGFVPLAFSGSKPLVFPTVAELRRERLER